MNSLVYASVIEAIKYGVIACDREEKIVLLNKAAEDFFMLIRDDVLGRRISDIFTLKAVTGFVTEALREITENEGQEICIKNPFGKEDILVVTTSLLRNPEGEVVGCMALLNNVTELRRYEKEIAKADLLAAVSEIAAGTAHEIRNPLTSARGFVQLLGSKYPPGSKEQMYVDTVMNELDRVNRIISNFLMLVKPDPAALELTHVNYLIQDILLLHEGQAALQNVKIQCNLGELPLCLMQPDQVKQVILNIVRNSLQAMPQGGNLVVETMPDQDQDYLKILISDTGKGIPPEHIGKIFVPFFSTKPEASGLGLTVAHRIVQNHGGKITVWSEEGNGTVVTIRLPVNADLTGSSYS